MPTVPALLLIDDNAIQAATRQAILRRAGYEVIAALDSARALEHLRTQECPAQIKLVVTDHLMPDMNGAEFVFELRKTHPSMPVLVISGMEEAKEQYRGMDVRFMVKPVLPEKLLAAVQSMIVQPG